MLVKSYQTDFLMASKRFWRNIQHPWRGRGIIPSGCAVKELLTQTWDIVDITAKEKEIPSEILRAFIMFWLLWLARVSDQDK